MKVLVACEESQTVCKAFRNKGHEAYSCDVLPCSGGHPEWHIQDDVSKILEQGWDLIIAHPPCTYLTITGNRWFNIERYGDKAIQRYKDREDAVKFFMQFVNCSCEKVCIENPVGYIGTYYRKADQIIHPYMFGHPVRKKTCLWLKGLPLLKPTKVVEPDIVKLGDGKTYSKWYLESSWYTPEERARHRSKTFEGIAEAMAEQWG